MERELVYIRDNDCDELPVDEFDELSPADFTETTGRVFYGRRKVGKERSFQAGVVRRGDQLYFVEGAGPENIELVEAYKEDTGEEFYIPGDASHQHPNLKPVPLDPEEQIEDIRDVFKKGRITVRHGSTSMDKIKEKRRRE